MKRKVLFLSLLLAIGSMVQAQTVRLSGHTMNSFVEKTIIREYSYPATISYVETAMGHLFIYNNGNLSLRQMRINSNTTVTDFVILNDVVYFCGENTGVAMFGYFNVSTLFGPNPTYYVIGSSMSSTANTVSTLDKMVAYDNNGRIELVAVGQTTGGQYCVAELLYDGVLWQYRVGELPFVFPSIDETILSITQTDDYVVTGGYQQYGTDYFPVFRAYRKSNIFASTGIQDYAFPTIYYSNTACRFDNSQMIMAPAHGNAFHIAAYWLNYKQSLPYLQGTYVGRYQIIPSTNSIGIEIQYQDGLQITQNYVSGGWKLLGLTNLPHSAQYFYLLQEAEIANYPNKVSMVSKLPYILSGASVVDAYYETDHNFQSIDGYNSNQFFVMDGTAYTNTLRHMYCEDYAFLSTGCLMRETFQSMPYALSEKYYLNAFSVTGYTAVSMISDQYGPIQNAATIIDCQQQ